MADGRSRTLVVIGSVAGDRGRQSNYVYGAAKAGLDAFAEGLAHRLHRTNVKVVTVKPGFVDTPMTAHLDRSGPLWAKPEAIAAAIDRAVAKGQRIVYAPWFWRPIMTAVRFAPRSAVLQDQALSATALTDHVHGPRAAASSSPAPPASSART